MTDDIVTRQEQEIDFVEYLRLWASPDGNDQAVRDLHKAADEIERLRGLVEHLSAQVRLQQIANDKAWEAYEQAVRGE